MSLVIILLFSAAILVSSYFYYGRYVSRMLDIDDNRTTPAHTLKDDVDYVPSKTPVVLGHHFASIAGAGPIVGPVIAVAFGWVPALIWIILGGIFMGAVHDLTSMVASLRHQGKTIGEVISHYIGDLGKKLFLIFSFATLVLVIAVFADIVAKTFTSVPAAATASSAFIFLALLFGLFIFRTRIPFWLSSVAGVVLMYSFVVLGDIFPLQLSYTTWMIILFIYIFAASVSPVWALLQPRDYLNSFLLYGMMMLGLAGVFVANPSIEMESSVSFHVESLGYLFPVLFVTVACGALSGFHSLVASGTTSKQLDKESDAVKVGFGGMLLESFLAVLAVGAVIVLSSGDYMARLTEAGPVSLFSEGLGGMIATLGIPQELAVSFVALTVSAFALTSLDTCTRLARLTVQEYIEDYDRAGRTHINFNNRYTATMFSLLMAALLVVSGGFAELWPIFGSANQLLGALALLAVSVWLIKKEVNPVFTLVPMVFMFAVTLSSLFLFAWQNFTELNYILGIIATLLFALAVVLIVLAKKSLHGYGKEEILSSKIKA